MSNFNRRFSASPRRTSLIVLSIGLIIVAGVLLLFTLFPAALDYLDAVNSDFQIYARKPVGPTRKVVIAAIDDASIAQFGRWPWARNIDARLLNALRQYKASVVGFDMVFSEPEFAGGDVSFGRAMAAYNRTYLGYFLRDRLSSTDFGVTSYTMAPLDPPPLAYKLVRKLSSGIQEPPSAVAYLPPIAEFNRASAGVAYLNIDEDIDGAVRSIPAVIRFGGMYCAPFFLAVAEAYLGQPLLSLTLSRYGVVQVFAGTRGIPTDQSGKMTLHYRGPAGRVPRYSVADLIAGRIPRRALEGKIIIVGVTATGLGDRFATPVGNDFPGVEIQATAVDNVVAGDFIRISWQTRQEEMILGVIAGIAIALSGAFIPGIFSLALTLILAAICLGYSELRLSYDSTFVGVALPWSVLAFTYLAVVTARYVSEGREKRYLRSVFELYLNRDVIESIVNNRAGLRLGGQRQHLSILFADIVDFTSRAESTEPENLVAFLNTYMTTMTNIILAHRGVVDKLMGDGIMAFWGAPMLSDNPARQALECALELLEQLRILAQSDHRFERVEIGIGIATGDAIVGNMGGENRFDYSAVGDKVNLAARLESLTRIFGARILADRRTLEESGDGFVAREIGLVQVKGKQQLVRVVEIGGDADAAYYASFAHAVETLRTGGSPEFELRQLLAQRPQDRVAAMWLERLQTAAADNHAMIFAFDAK